MEYRIITGHTIESLERSVNGFLKAGWQLQGGVFIYLGTLQIIYFAQAMIKIN